MVGIDTEAMTLKYFYKHSVQRGVADLRFLATHPANEVVMRLEPGNLIQGFVAPGVGRNHQP